ncbi:MAG: hypothetical protein JJU06_20470 [Ectothiorhodospiraceae bacterium]|nr:hypothetical protein [Ectothiorhodospiraceae bacterium]MCH8505836.1 hypothetical protein [Ectothiorhodospiraceae bacterium]
MTDGVDEVHGGHVGRVSRGVAGRDAVIKLGREVFADCQRLEMGDLAARLGISRITLYRWVGDRETLVSMVLWSLTEDLLEAAERRATVNGEVVFFDAYQNFNRYLLRSTPLIHFIREEPQFALKTLTRPDGIIRTRLEAAFRAMLEREVKRRGRALELAPETLAYVILCLGESYLYPPIVLNHEPDLAKAEEVVRLLLR